MTSTNKALRMDKLGYMAGVCACLLSQQVAHAQTLGPTVADVLRNIGQSQQRTNSITPKSETKKTPIPTTTEQDFSRLGAVQVNSPLFQDDLLTYWTSEINKPVSTQKLADFKAYAWDLFQKRGYLAYINISAQPMHEGSILTVNVTFPSVRKISVVTADGDKGKEFADEVARRFTAIYQTGTSVDVQGFENQLNAASYDLPVDLEVSLRQVDAKQVDVVINLRPVEHKIGNVLGGLVQLNNSGLDQFGRTQLLSNVRLAGFHPLSELSLTTQQSSGVGYYRANYLTPIVGAGMQWNTYVSEVRSHANLVRGLSSEVGLGLTKLLSADRIGRWLASAELSKRQTQNWTSDIESSNRTDQQVRFKLRAESSKGWVDNFSNEITLVTGLMNLDRNQADGSNDATGLKVAGPYQKLEMNGGLSQALNNDGVYTGTIRWHVQTASKNLDTYNRTSLGGVNGIRAYTSLDGEGDQGAQVSFDIIHQVVPDAYFGLFYDVGWVRNSRTPLATATNTGYYPLQGIGWQVGGRIEDVSWSLSIAHAIGKTPGPGVWTSANTQVGDWRIDTVITKPF
jgi:hemolysin activation/secretion protein